MTRRAAMILAAGFGTRMGALTATRPKPLIEVAGRPLIDHAIAAAGDASPLVVNGHYLAAQLGAYLSRTQPKVTFVEEKGAILDSGGGIKNALPHFGSDPILTLNADAVWHGPPPCEVLDRHWRPDEMDGLLLLVSLGRATGRQGGGDFALGHGGRLSWDKGPSGMVYTGAQIIRTERIAARPQAVFSLLEIWQDMMDQRRLFGCVYPGGWADVGHPEGVAAAEAMVGYHAV